MTGTDLVSGLFLRVDGQRLLLSCQKRCFEWIEHGPIPFVSICVKMSMGEQFCRA